MAGEIDDLASSNFPFQTVPYSAVVVADEPDVVPCGTVLAALTLDGFQLEHRGLVVEPFQTAHAAASFRCTCCTSSFQRTSAAAADGLAVEPAAAVVADELVVAD